MKAMIVATTVAALMTVTSVAAQYDYGGWYDGYGGYGGYGDCCECTPTSKPTKPTTPKPTPRPTFQFPTETVCFTDGGYAPQGTLCQASFNWKQGSQPVVKRNGCQSTTTGKFIPFVNTAVAPQSPSEGGDAGLWCPTQPTYNRGNANGKENWGYCRCPEFGCLKDTNEAMIKQAVEVHKTLTNAQKQKFRSVIGTGTTSLWYPFEEVDYTGEKQPKCYTDGGKSRGVECKPTWTYSKPNAKKPNQSVVELITGCAETNVFKPFTGGNVLAPQNAKTVKARYCATVDFYDPRKNSSTKGSWGYCSCLSNVDLIAVNQMIAAYNPLVKSERNKFWNQANKG